MKDEKLVIKEKYSKYWPTVAVLSLILSLVIFVSYHFIDNVLWIGYLRLAAFAFFAVALLSFFKVYDGQVELTVLADEEFFKSTYQVRNEIIFESEQPRSVFHQVKTDQLPNKSIYNDFMKNDRCVRFQKKDENAWYYFNEIESRVIPLSEENANTLRDFLKMYSEA